MKHFTTKIGLLAIAVTILLSACGGGSGTKYTLEYNLKTGETYMQNLEMNVVMEQDIMGQKMNTTNNTGMSMSSFVSGEENGIYSIDMKFDKIKMEMVMPMGAMTFDSETEDTIATPQNPNAMFKAMTGIPLEMKMDKQGKVSSVKGFDKIVNAMVNSLDESIDAEAKQQIVTQFAEQFNEAAIKQSFEQSSNYYPAKPVSIGESWSSSLDLKSGNIEIKTTNKMTLTSVENNIATLEAEGTISTPEGGFVQEMDGMQIKMLMKGTLKGTIKLDINTGWPINMDMVMDINDGQMEAMGTNIPMTMVIKTKMTNL